MTETMDGSADEQLFDFTFRQNGLEKPDITLDGQPIAGHLSHLDIEAGAGAFGPPVVTLTLSQRPDRPVIFESMARVQIAETEPGPGAAVFLSAIDAETLEKAALNRHDLGTEPGDLTRAMLQQLIEWARGD